MIAHIEAVTQRRVEVIVGKPSPITIEAAMEVLGLPAAACILVGDRIETDIRMGIEAGMTTAMVLTGVTDAAALLASAYRPDHVLESIAEMPAILKHRTARFPQPPQRPWPHRGSCPPGGKAPAARAGGNTTAPVAQRGLGGSRGAPLTPVILSLPIG